MERYKLINKFCVLLSPEQKENNKEKHKRVARLNQCIQKIQQKIINKKKISKLRIL